MKNHHAICRAAFPGRALGRLSSLDGERVGVLSVSREARFTLALTLTLSPGEREQLCASLDSPGDSRVISASWSCAEKAAPKPNRSALPQRGQRFSLSWGRGLG